MPLKTSIPYINFLKETTEAIENSYPVDQKSTIIGASTIIYEINANPDKYPLYAKIKSDRRKRIIITHNCLDHLKYQQRGKARGSCKNGAVYIRGL